MVEGELKKFCLLLQPEFLSTDDQFYRGLDEAILVALTLVR